MPLDRTRVLRFLQLERLDDLLDLAIALCEVRLERVELERLARGAVAHFVVLLQIGSGGSAHAPMSALERARTCCSRSICSRSSDTSSTSSAVVELAAALSCAISSAASSRAVLEARRSYSRSSFSCWSSSRAASDSSRRAARSCGRRGASQLIRGGGNSGRIGRVEHYEVEVVENRAEQGHEIQKEELTIDPLLSPARPPPSRTADSS